MHTPTHTPNSFLGYVPALLAGLALTACGSSDDDSGGSSGPGATASFQVGGTVTGLDGTLVLQNNGADDLTITQDGSFTFPTLLADGSTYDVTVLSAPVDQSCTITGGSGTLAGSDITDVGATCVDLEDFEVRSSTLVDGSQWQLNRPIDITFNKDLDFGTVSSATIQVVDDAGQFAVGTFAAVDARTVRFQPRCPTNEESSDGGLAKGTAYSLSIPSVSTGGPGAITVLSTAGESLDLGLSAGFMTPDSVDPLQLFVDLVPGPPMARVRGLRGEALDSQDASYIEFGMDPNNVEFFEFSTGAAGAGLPNASNFLTAAVPLNLYSQLSQQFAVVLRFDQPVFAGSSNINGQSIGMEFGYEQTPGQGDVATWSGVPTEVSLVENCTETGAAVRVEPFGILPQGALLRVVVREGFRDLTGDALVVDQTEIARMQASALDPSMVNGDPNAGVDEIFAGFQGSGPEFLEDTAVVSALPRADWGVDGTLTASFDFGGTGGPGGDFDWIIRAGDQVILNTDFDTILGGPDGFPTAVQNVIGGVINVRNLTIEPGGRLIMLGSNTCTILATGVVRIEGSVTLDGGDNFGVATLNTTNQPEAGAPGQVGGGDGGVGSFLTNQSTPRGGAGNGAFDLPGLGGEGGETSFAPPGTCGSEDRRGAGGGGGLLGDDIRYLWNGNSVRCQTLVGMDAEPGFTGSPDGTGAVSQTQAAMGGSIAPSPFLDGDPENNFFGSKITTDGRLVLGELTSVWAGSGGGAGGDASRTTSFPTTPFSAFGDEKGSGGGGGAGGLMLLALGNIEVLGEGTISANGGDGGAGENTVFFDRIGGGSGGGSGGHIVLSSAQSIVIEAEANDASVGSFYLDDLDFPIHEMRPLSALGGQGGAGKDSRCGANEQGPTQWLGDAIPLSAFEGDTTVPPQGQLQWQQCNRIDSCSINQPPPGTVPGGGGDGGPGIIQLHVSDPATQLQFGGAIAGSQFDPTRSMAPPPYGWSGPMEAAERMVPFFANQSEAFSQWIPLGLARFNADGSTNQVELLFDGTSAADGRVIRDGASAQLLDPLVDFTPISIDGSAPSVSAAASTFTFPASAIEDLYLRNPALTEGFSIRLQTAGVVGGVVHEFEILAASFDGAAMVFTATVDPNGTELQDLVSSPPSAGFEAALQPYFFRMLTDGVLDAYPLDAEVGIAFDAMRPDASAGGMRVFSEAVNGGAYANDIADLNAEPWEFVRFRVQFTLSNGGPAGPDTPRPGVDFLRIPFRF